MSVTQFDEPFISSYFEQDFDEFVSDIFVYLGKKNSKYKSLLDKRKNILYNYPNLRLIIEDDESVALTKEEVGKLVEYLILEDERKSIEEKELFLRGVREAYYLFKRIKIIK